MPRVPGKQLRWVKRALADLGNAPLDGVGSLTLVGQMDLEPGDEIEIRMANLEGSSDIDVELGSVVVKE